MNLPEINTNEIELKYSNAKIQDTPQINELFKEYSIDYSGFMEKFRKYYLVKDLKNLVQLAYDNYDENIHTNNLWWFELLSKLFSLNNLDITAESLYNQASELKIQRTVEETLESMNEKLGYIELIK